jgi:hypothetical protein
VLPRFKELGRASFYDPGTAQPIYNGIFDALTGFFQVIGQTGGRHLF